MKLSELWKKPGEVLRFLFFTQHPSTIFFNITVYAYINYTAFYWVKFLDTKDTMCAKSKSFIFLAATFKSVIHTFCLLLIYNTLYSFTHVCVHLSKIMDRLCLWFTSTTIKHRTCKQVWEQKNNSPFMNLSKTAKWETYDKVKNLQQKATVQLTSWKQCSPSSF